jgi:phage terminase large subunit-like protein
MAPALQRIVVAVDPAASSDPDTSDENGIVGVGKDDRYPPHYYVLEDRSLIGTPNEWAVAVVNVYRELKADRVVGEQNNGGQMVESTVRNVDANVSYKGVHASRGKLVRAEPASALYEQGRVHHVGAFPKLEDQMCEWNPTTGAKSPDRMDALVWALAELTEANDGDAHLEYMRQQAAAVTARQQGVPCPTPTSRSDVPPWRSAP